MKSINDFPAWSTPHMVEDAKEAKNHRVSSYLSALIKQAADRHVQLITLPLGMSRQMENKSRYIFGKGLIMWYAKWNLASIAPILSFSTRCSELDVVGEVFQAELSNLSVGEIVHSSIVESSLSSGSQIQNVLAGPTDSSDGEIHSLRSLAGVTLLKRVLHRSTRSDVPRYSRWNHAS